ncbi:MAG: DUF5689 domain-containing protein [Polaribacter sp.]|uniref:DUF5689 domain-containing protein n=1 Tax=Polaribacter sp. TaxID=1920175 RepID=UPI003BB131A1
MKTNKIIILLLAFITSISFTSCVQDGDYTVPSDLGIAENDAVVKIIADITAGTKSEITVANLKGLFVNGQVTEITSNTVVKGFVTSSDQTGNFYKELYIQDKAENPTAAIKVVMELTDSYNKFNIGREIYIDLNGLFIGEVRSGDGIVAIGGDKNDDDEVENLSINQVTAKMFRSSKTEAIVALPALISELNEAKIGMFVEVQNVFFADNLAGKTYVDADDQFDTQRIFNGCSGFDIANFILETSAFADFKFSTIPAGGGTISGVVSKTFNGSDLVLALNSTSDVKLGGAKCEALDISTFNQTFVEEFNNITTNWTSYNISGAETWGTTTFGNPGTAARASGYSGSAKTNEDWLVSKAIDISTSSSAFVIFETVKRFGGNDLEFFYSKDYTGGDPTVAANGTWVKLSPALDTNVNSWTSWTSSGAVDISAAAGGNVFVAFKYTSTTSDAATFQIDNLKVLTQ